MKTAIGLLVFLCGLSVTVRAEECGPGPHDPTIWWEVGRYYAHPSGDVIETLAEVCGGYDFIEVTPGDVRRVCAVREIAARNVRGHALFPQTRKVVVYKRNEQLHYATGFFAFPAEIGDWTPLPRGCYPASAVVSVVNDILQVRVP